ncbi:MAG: CGGC domain protein [Alphaproteobacteria bacterium ADurb.Bin438]|nr:MAG: CGGC domain protein [Alphaproteobacteria bacterium ADurb.Bin438]
MKVGIIRCNQTEDLCPGTSCFKALKTGSGAFQNSSENEIIGFVSCGGCPGKKAIPRALKMIEKGADAIAISTCISKGAPIKFPCPHFEMIKNALKQNLPENIKILDNTH